MNDRELLELAAKAAGIETAIIYDEDDGLGPYCKTGKHAYWRPLQDDGDALRLAVKLHFALDVGCMSTSVDGLLDSDKGMAPELHGGDPCAATRRAIVRAAAEIGKKMEASTPAV
jgi:hypothetical protein